MLEGEMRGTLVAAGAGLAGVLALALIWPPGAGAQGEGRAEFCEHQGYRGYCFTLYGSEPNFGRSGLMNDQASSIRVTGRWLICSDGAYRGSCVEVADDVFDLSGLRMNDRLSSARYIGPVALPPPPPPPPPPPTQAVVTQPPAVASDVPVNVQRAMVQRKIDAAMAGDAYPEALDLMDEYRALGGLVPLALLLIESDAAIKAGDPQRARAALVDYFNRAGEDDAGFAGALDLFQLVQDAVPEPSPPTASAAPAPADTAGTSGSLSSSMAPGCEALEAQTIANIQRIAASSTGNQCMALRDAANVYDEAVRFFQTCPSYDPTGEATRQMQTLASQSRQILADCGTVRPYR